MSAQGSTTTNIAEYRSTNERTQQLCWHNKLFQLQGEALIKVISPKTSWPVNKIIKPSWTAYPHHSALAAWRYWITELNDKSSRLGRNMTLLWYPWILVAWTRTRGTRVTCSGQNEGITRWRDYKEILVVIEPGAVVDEVDRFGAEQVPGVSLPCAPLTKQPHT